MRRSQLECGLGQCVRDGTPDCLIAQTSHDALAVKPASQSLRGLTADVRRAGACAGNPARNTSEIPP
jgi:hypothetical protein